MGVEVFQRVLSGSNPKQALEGKLEVQTSEFSFEERNDLETERPGRIIRDIRKRMGMTQKDFARKIGISPATVSRIERGKTSLKKVLKLEDVEEVLSLVKDVAPNEQMKRKNRYLLLELRRAIQGRPTRKNIQRWISSHIRDIWKKKAFYTVLEEGNGKEKSTYLFLGMKEK